uniref:C2H2-type domain-containing protein n=1 Tax=Graphocephala atropunctata TaxID=36148 RepID=A0A1B6KK68_9HEMI
MSVVTSYNTPYGFSRYEGKNDSGNGTGAMLNMLAEVATQTLWADNRAGSSSPSPPPAPTPTPALATVTKKKRSRETSGMPLNQARMLSVNQLVRTFSRFEGDELRRVFSFQCLLIPKKCGVRFESFGNETKARNLIKDHLLAHLEDLPEGEVLQVPKQQEDMSYRKATSQIKTQRKIKTIKPVEVKPVIETSEIPIEACNEVVVETENATNPNPDTISVALAECYKKLQSIPGSGKAEDHDYFRPEDQILPTAKEQYTGVETIWIKSEDTQDDASSITNYMVTVTDNGDHPMLSVSNEVVIKTEIDVEESEMDVSSDFLQPMTDDQIVTLTVKSEELPILQEREGCVERDEHRQHKKPKGKAKFIGQSAAEKEMAVRMIESMKLKQGTSDPLECQICVPSRVFTAPTTLISHYRSHAGIKPYECHLCGGVFTRQHSLNYHLLIHSNKTRFTCSDCGRKFRHPSHFKEHQRRHTGEAPFECSDCVIRFKTRNTYKRHLKTRHGKVLTQSGGIIILSEEEFRRVRTAPRSLQTRVSSDKENNRRPRTKVVNIVRRGKKRTGEEEGEDFVQKYNLSGNWSTNLLEPEEQDGETQQVTILQAVGGSSGPTTVMVLSADNILYNNIAT